MNRYPTEEKSFRDLLKRAVRLHYLTLKHTIPCILAMTIIKYIPIFLGLFFTNTIIMLFFYFLATTGILYFFSVALYITNSAFLDKTLSFKKGMQTIWKNKKIIFISFWTFVAGVFFLYYCANYGTFFFAKLSHDSSLSHMKGFVLFILLCILATYIAMFYFSYSIVILDKKNIFPAFQESILLTEKNKLGVLFLFLILFMTLLLLTPGMIHEYLLSTYHLDMVFDFIALSVVVPIYINLLLFLIHDSKLQVQ